METKKELVERLGDEKGIGRTAGSVDAGYGG